MSLHLFILVSTLQLCISYVSSAVQVQVEEGVLEGQIIETVDGLTCYYSFKGIPYAAPPVGELRFQAPQPPLSWEGVRNATEHGSICPQFDNINGIIQNLTEDCLFINVYSPEINTETLLPVIFLIPGGAHKFGSGNDFEFGPDFLMSKDVVLVTFNYRVDSLGFLCLDTEQVPGNAGNKDQVAALRWVIANIANFGGDPDNITVMGQSASAASVGLFLVSPMTKGLFKRAIMLSGSPLSEWNLHFEPAQRGITLGKQLGSNTDDPQEAYDFLKNVPVATIINNTTPITLAEERLITLLFKCLTFVPVVEKDFGQERFLTDDVIHLLENGEIHEGVSVLFGRTNQEIIVFIASIIEVLTSSYELIPDLQTPRDILYELPVRNNLEVAEIVDEHYFGNKTISLETLPEFVELLSDMFVNYPLNRFIDKLPESGNGQKFGYIFSVFTERNVYGGLSHGDDLAYIFDPKGFNLTLNLDSPEYETIQRFTTFIAKAFGHFGTLKTTRPLFHAPFFILRPSTKP